MYLDIRSCFSPMWVEIKATRQKGKWLRFGYCSSLMTKIYYMKYMRYDST